MSELYEQLSQRVTHTVIDQRKKISFVYCPSLFLGLCMPSLLRIFGVELVVNMASHHPTVECLFRQKEFLDT